MSKKTQRQGKPAHASATKAASVRQYEAKVAHRRGARHSHKATVAKDDRSAALAVLAAVGAEPADPRVLLLAEIFRGAKANMATVDADVSATPWDDYEEIKRALQDAKVETELGEALKAMLLRVLRGHPFPLRFLPQARVLDPARTLDAYFLRLGGLVVRDGRVVPSIAEARPGRPVALDIKQTILIAEDKYGWNWKVCAAAVFVTDAAVSVPGAKPPKYEFIRKAFGDWVRRNKHRA